VTGDNILVGNSATATGNHFDMFEHIRKSGLAGRKIICPLNYGYEDYRLRVVARGKELFREDFVPICERMELQDYLKILASCSFAVMGHIRQQAGGNIFAMLNLGAKVFLDTRNPWYKFFKKEDAFIYSLSEAEREAGSRLDAGQIERNREILGKHWGREAIRRKTMELIDSVSRKRAVK
jgi:hypothetical protein